MNSTDPSSHAPEVTRSSAEFERLRRQHETLRFYFVAVLASLIILAVGVDLFIGKQMRLARNQVKYQRPLLNQAQSNFQRQHEPVIKRFTGRLQAFARTNSDFQPVLEKYQPALGRFLTGAPSPVQPAGSVTSEP